MTVDDHKALKHEPWKFKCETCYKQFALERDIKKHKETVHAKMKNHKCTECGTYFGLISTLKVHLLKIHGNGIKTISCDFCDKLFFNEGDKIKHVRVIHQKVVTNHCEPCNRDFVWSSHYKRHMVIEHSTSKLPKSECDICFKLFDTVGMSKHKKIHKKHRKGKIHKCYLCTGSFYDKYALKHHVNKTENNFQSFEARASEYKQKRYLNYFVH